MHTLYYSFGGISVESKTIAFSFLSNVNTEYEDVQLLKLENLFSQFIKKFKADFDPLLLDDEDFENMVQQIVNFAGKDRIKAIYPEYKKPGALDESVKKLLKELQRSYANADNLIQCLDQVAGKDTIPVMTVHKSKGLEYHTVIFLGLEDQAFWSFDRQPDEDKCTFFVALSRAKERVVFTFSGLRKNKWDQMEQQNLSKIKILFTELENSGIAQLEEISGT